MERGERGRRGKGRGGKREGWVLVNKEEFFKGTRKGMEMINVSGWDTSERRKSGSLTSQCNSRFRIMKSGCDFGLGFSF